MIFIIVLLAVGNQAFSQDIYDSMAVELCTCLQKNKINKVEDSQLCTENTVITNFPKLIAHYNVLSYKEIDPAEVGQKLMARLLRNCVYLQNLDKDEIEAHNPQFVADEKPICTAHHIGNYFYAMPGADGNQDTTYVHFSQDQYLEQMHGGSTYSLLDIDWTTDCHFKLSFVESDDPFKKSLSKKGDTYEYEILKVNENSFIAQYMWEGPDSFIVFWKVD